MKKIPILLTTYNRLEYTKKSLSSIIENTSDSGILYIIDNASTDGTIEYLNSIEHSMVEKIIFNDTNIGVSGAMNQFFDIIKDDYEYFAKVDNDTIVPPGWLNSLLSALVEADIDIVQAKHYFVLSNFFDWDDLVSRCRTLDVFGGKLIFYHNVGGSGIIAKTSIIKEIDESLGLSGWVTLQRANKDCKSAFFDGVTVDILDIVGYNRLKFSDLEYHIETGRTPIDDIPAVSILIPTIREEGLKNCIKHITENACVPNMLYEIISEEDNDRIGCPLTLKNLWRGLNMILSCF